MPYKGVEPGVSERMEVINITELKKGRWANGANVCCAEEKLPTATPLSTPLKVHSSLPQSIVYHRHLSLTLVFSRVIHWGPFITTLHEVR